MNSLINALLGINNNLNGLLRIPILVENPIVITSDFSYDLKPLISWYEITGAISYEISLYNDFSEKITISSNAYEFEQEFNIGENTLYIRPIFTYGPGDSSKITFYIFEREATTIVIANPINRILKEKSGKRIILKNNPEIDKIDYNKIKNFNTYYEILSNMKQIDKTIESEFVKMIIKEKTKTKYDYKDDLAFLEAMDKQIKLLMEEIDVGGSNIIKMIEDGAYFENKFIKKVNIDIPNFYYLTPVDFTLEVTFKNKIVKTFPIIPFYFDGEYIEKITIDKKTNVNTSKFRVDNNGEIKFFTTSMDQIYPKYEISFGLINVFNDNISYENIIVKYNPVSTSFSVEINEYVKAIKLKKSEYFKSNTRIMIGE